MYDNEFFDQYNKSLLSLNLPSTYVGKEATFFLICKPKTQYYYNSQ